MQLTTSEKDLKLFSIFSGIFVTSLLVSNVTASKIFALGTLTFSGGVILFPISYIFGDILTEVYGYERSRKIIWIGFLCQVLAAVAYYITVILPPAPFWHDQTAFATVLGVVPRIALASILGYLAGEFCNSFVISKMKYRVEGRRGLQQAWRFVVSTIVGQAVDTVVFMAIAFAAVLTANQIIATGAGIYAFKVIYAIIVTPLSVKLANWTKRVEGIDHIDVPEQTNYNPFTLTE